MKIIIKKDYDEVSKKAAEILKQEIKKTPETSLGLATGSTPLGLYKELIKEYKKGEIDFSKVKTFNLDEYYPITKDDPQSYHYFMHENFFNHINIKKQNIHLLNGLAKDPDQECEKYEEKLKDTKRTQILGIGTNGHIAFNEPGSSFNSRTRQVELSKNTIKDNSRFFKKEEEVPKYALTMGLKTILESKKIILLATGEKKAEVIKKVIEQDINPAIPATILKKHRDVTIILDEEAAKKLKKIPRNINGHTILTSQNMPENKNIMVISPHPDDSCINPGGTIIKLAQSNNIDILVMTTGHRASINNKTKEERIKIREDEVKKECKILDAKPHFCRLKFYDEDEIKEDTETIKQKIKELKPDIILIPHENDEHKTHLISRQIVLNALKELKQKTELWNYETTWSLFKNKKFNMIVPLTNYEIQQKIKSIECHKSQIARTRYDQAAKALASFRAALIPEQALTTYGKEGMKLAKYIELIQIEH